MFSSAHWQYVAQLQATKQPISTGFYISITLAITACILGLYILFRPRFRKIKFTTPQPTAQVNNNNAEQKNTINNTITPQQSKPTINIQPIIQRPPRLHIQQTQFAQKNAQQNKPEQKNNNKPNLLYTDEMREIFEKSDYRVLTPRIIRNTPLSLIALGANESLWLGAANISHEQMVNIMTEFKSVFQETLDDIEIDINAFIINPTDNESVDAILDFESIDDLSLAIAEQPNIPNESNDDSDNMDAFAGYIDTVITYLGNK
jgi:hypothetical protein